MSRNNWWTIAVGLNICLASLAWYLGSELHAQNVAVQAIAQSLQGKPPIQVTVDFGQQTGAMLTDALKDKSEKRSKK